MKKEKDCDITIEARQILSELREGAVQDGTNKMTMKEIILETEKICRHCGLDPQSHEIPRQARNDAVINVFNRQYNAEIALYRKERQKRYESGE